MISIHSIRQRNQIWLLVFFPMLFSGCLRGDGGPSYIRQLAVTVSDSDKKPLENVRVTLRQGFQDYASVESFKSSLDFQAASGFATATTNTIGQASLRLPVSGPSPRARFAFIRLERDAKVLYGTISLDPSATATMSQVSLHIDALGPSIKGEYDGKGTRTGT